MTHYIIGFIVSIFIIRWLLKRFKKEQSTLAITNANELTELKMKNMEQEAQILQKDFEISILKLKVEMLQNRNDVNEIERLYDLPDTRS